MSDEPKILCVDRRSMPMEGPLGSIDYSVVLVAGHIGDYAAYIGSGSDEFVARHGNKLSFNQADAHFCGQLEEAKYRR